MTRASGAIPISCHTLIAETTNEATIASEARPPETLFGSRRPSIALMTKPTSGNRGISASTRSPLERLERVRVERLPVAEERDDDRQADGSFRGRDRQYEERDELNGDVTAEAPERDERQVDCIEHDLDRQQ